MSGKESRLTVEQRERAEKKSLKASERKEVRKVEKKGGVGRTQKTLPRTSEPVR